MAADNEIRLINRVIIDKNMSTVIERGVQPDWFVNPDAKGVWKWMLKYWGKYGTVPSPASVKSEWPTFRLLNVQDPLDYLLDQFIEYRRHVHVEDMLVAAAQELSNNNDHNAAMALVEKALAQIYSEGTPGTSDLILTDDPEARFEEYEDREANAGSLLGLPTGYEKIDEATAGLQPGQLVTVIAPPKTGKSQILLQTAINIHEAGHRVLLQTFEMSNTECQTRHDAMRSHVSHARLQRFALDKSEKSRYQKMLQNLKGSRESLVLTDALHGVTVSALAAKIDQHKPDVVFVDGVYLMLDEQTGEFNTPQAITNVTRALKKLAQNKKIPVVISTQTLLWKMKGGKVTADSIGYSSSFFQDSDVILGLQEVDQEDEMRELKIVASRNCGPDNTYLIWRWDTGCFHDESLENTCPGCKVANKWTANTVPSPTKTSAP